MKIRNIMTGLLLGAIIAGSGACYAANYLCSYSKDGVIYTKPFNSDESKEESCAWLNSDFFKKSDPEAHDDCLTDYDKLKEAYDAKKCTPVLKKTHTSGSASCVIEYYYENGKKKFYSSNCTGASDDYIKKVKALYN